MLASAETRKMVDAARSLNGLDSLNFMVLLDGGREAGAKAYIGHFVFAIDCRLDFSVGTDLFHETYNPTQFIGIGVQFVTVSDVFHFGKGLVENAAGRKFGKYWVS